METDKNYFLVGLFFITMILACIGFSLWLTSSGRGDYSHYRIRFAESVSGLTKESAVKFRGVDIGNVEKISIDPKDSKLIQVEIRILKSTPIKIDTTATLKLYGITGEVYVELSGGSYDAPRLEAKNNELPEIQAKPSSIDAVLNGLPILLKKANHVADQLSKIFSDENVRSVNSITRKLSERYRDKEDQKKGCK
jgi:phospholipid/cholesterol/gamma-HCH transport system substrate-binding protein